jgi:hypothetical protein
MFQGHGYSYLAQNKLSYFLWNESCVLLLTLARQLQCGPFSQSEPQWERNEGGVKVTTLLGLTWCTRPRCSGF